jgi:hypothetical protein
VVILMSDATTAGGRWDRRRWLILTLTGGTKTWLQLGRAAIHGTRPSSV